MNKEQRKFKKVMKERKIRKSYERRKINKFGAPLSIHAIQEYKSKK